MHGDDQGKGGLATARAVEAEVVGAALVGSQGSQEPWPSGAASRRVRAASERGEREPVGIECRPSGAAKVRGERAWRARGEPLGACGEWARRARAASRWARTARVRAASDRQALAASGRGERACGDDSGARPRSREGARIRNQASAAITFQTDQRDLLLTFQIADLLLAFQKTKLINADQRGARPMRGRVQGGAV